MSMLQSATTYVAHQNDLYEVVYNPQDGNIIKATLYEDNASRAGVEVIFWQLPLVTRQRILRKIEKERA